MAIRWRPWTHGAQQSGGAPVLNGATATAAPGVVGTTLTLPSVMIPAINNRGLVVDLFVYYSGGAPGLPVSVKLGAVACALMASVVTTIGFIIQGRYYLIAPASGTANVILDCSAAGVPTNCFIAATPLTGVSQSSPFQVSVTNVWDQVNFVATWNKTDPAGDVTRLEYDCSLGLSGANFPQIQPAAGQLRVFDLPGGPDFAFASSTRAKTAAAINMAWTGASGIPAGVGFSQIATAFNAA